jgi:hypothetical protein
MRSASLLVVALALCGAACDDTESKDGARGSCASGGALAGCDDAERTAEAACWRLVECGAYPLESDEPDPNVRDWGSCVNRLETMVEERAALVITCIVSSTCDELQAPGSPNPYEDAACFDYGAL